MSVFGKLLRVKRRNSQDLERGGPLTQIRLGELIGDYLGDMGYSGAAISHWENGRASPSQNEREVLIALLYVLHQAGGLNSRDEANKLLAAGGYLTLTESEARILDTTWVDESEAAVPLSPQTTPEDWSRLRHYLPVSLFEQVKNAAPDQRQALCLPHLQQLLATTITYIPRHQALAQLAKPMAPRAQRSGAFIEGTLLFADISGFTELSERLHQMGGKEGAEKIVAIVNRFLDTMLAILFQHDGRLINFGGDAMLCLFTGAKGSAMNALWAAWEMNQAMAAQFAQIEIFQELFQLNMKVGNSSGLLFTAIVGDETHLEYMLTGSALERTAQAEAVAHRGDIIVSQETYEQVSSQVRAEPLPDFEGLYRITAVPTPPSRDSQASWSAVMFQIYEQTVDVWQVAAWLEALTPYLSVGLLPQLVHDPRAEHLESQHRRVTVLFANFQGMSRVVAAHGPEKAEKISAVLQEYFQAMQEEVHYYGGATHKVDLYDQGDKLMVLFGAPAAHERDARRAALTALAMQRRMNQLAAPLAGIFLSQRIGIHTGYVFAGNVGSATQHRREYTVMGNTVNLAARLMSAAAPDEIWISQAVWEQIQAEFAATPQPPQPVQGYAEPVPMLRLEAFSGESDSPLPRLQAPLTGRQTELDKLLARTDEMISGSHKQIIAVTGEGGVGKSRLVQSWREQLKNSAAPIIDWLAGYGRSYGQPTYGLVVEIARELIGVEDGDGPAVCWRKVDRYLGQNWAEGETPPDRLLQRQACLGFFLGLDLSLRQGASERINQLEGKSLQRQIWLAVTDLFAMSARQRPLVLILEDLHWADEASLALLKFMIDHLPDAIPIAFCLVYRSRKELPVWQTWHDIKRDHPDCLEIAVEELDGAARVSLLHQLLGLEEPLEAAFEQLVLDETDGNPLYLEEVLYRLIADNVLVATATGWHLSQPVTKLAVPDTLQQMIQSRIDDLDYTSPGARRLLWLAAVSGRTFSSEGLAHLFRQSGRDPVEFQSHFRVLRNAAMFERAQVMVGDESRSGFRFRHGLVQQVAYDNMPVTHRRQYHQQVGQWLEAAHQASLVAHYETLAHHFAQGQEWGKAFHYYFLAGQRDGHAYANDSAQRFLWLALSLAKEARPDRFLLAQAHFEFGKTLAVMGEFAEAKSHLTAAYDLLSSLMQETSVLLQARVCYEIGRLYEQAGGQANFDEALTWQKRGIDKLTAAGFAQGVEAAMLHALAGLVYLRSGRLSQAEAACQQSLTIAKTADNSWLLGFVYRLLSIAARYQGEAAQAIAYIQQSLAISETSGDLLSLGKDYSNLGVYLFEADNWRDAAVAYRQAITVLERSGDQYQLAMTCGNLGDLYAHTGDWEQGLPFAERSLALFQQQGASQGIVFSHIVLATLYWRQAAFDQMTAALTEADALAKAHGVSEFDLDIARWLAQAALSQGDPAPALALIAPWLNQADDAEDDGLEPLYRLQAEALAAQGDREQALAVLEASRERLLATGSRYQLGQVLLALARVLVADSGRQAQAHTYAQEAHTILEQFGASSDATVAEILLAALAQEG
jgi:class 3 adenylate cyclase/tetratricopeptide (TPR) repeat protein